MKSLYKTLLLLVLPVITMAHNREFKGKYTKEKTVQKEFTVNNDAELEVLNKYGNISVTTWNENRTVIDIVIRTNGNNESKVQKRLDDITIEITGNLSRVSAITSFGKESNGWGWNNKNNKNIAVEVNYTIKIPNTNSVNLSNKYGAINVGDLQGKVVINHKYGHITIGELQAENNSITMKYVKSASIKYLKSGKINAGYSTFSLDGSERLLLETNYTTSNLGKMGDLNYENKYGKLRVESASNVEGNAAYNDGTFGSISGAASFNVKYSTISIELLTASTTNANFNGKYSSFNLGIHNDYAFNFDINLRYGSLKGKDKLIFITRNTKNNTGEYKGYHNTENSGNNLNINSSYGSVTIK